MFASAENLLFQKFNTNNKSRNSDFVREIFCDSNTQKISDFCVFFCGIIGTSSEAF